MIAVTVVNRNRETALVQWNNKRAYIPLAAITAEGRVTEDDLDAAVQIGERWESCWEASTLTARMAAELRRAGFWTREDVAANVAGAQKAVARVVGVEFVQNVNRRKS